jgi:uncharacterized protein involved in exopolysaccharide biosynthesis
MELKRYWGIIWRRLWLVLTLVAIVLASYVLLASEPHRALAAACALSWACGLSRVRLLQL